MNLPLATRSLDFLRQRWPSIVIAGSTLVLLIQALEWVNRCACPVFLDYPGYGTVTGLVIGYLGLAYLALFALLGARLALSLVAQGRLSRRWQRPARSLDRHNLLISLGIVVILLPIFAHSHQIRWANNLSIALAYALLLFRIVLLVDWRMAANGYALNRSGQQLYIAYGIGILLLIGFIPSVDGRDPFGTQFQLQIVCVLLILHLVSSWVSAQWRRAQQQESERVANELSLLKAQINPHFLFNTLNNLYGLAKEGSPDTPDLILRLSALLRHTVHQGRQDSVALSDEIAYLQDYIALQQIRYARSVRVEFETELDRDDYRLAPLLLVVLLENAYKHGVEPLAGDAFVRMRLIAQRSHLCFKIENSFVPSTSDETESGGVGLRNLSRRLQLEYPGRHRWQHGAGAGNYRAQLELELNP